MKEHINWKDLVTTIDHAATRDGVKQWKIEAIFQIGDGTGRVWRSWRSGQRKARPDLQSRIIDCAISRGWLNVPSLLPSIKISADKHLAKATDVHAVPSERTKQKRHSWAIVIAMITKSAWEAGLSSNAALENYFNVGDGTGRVWYSWINEQRCARSLTRERIEAVALEKKWFQPKEKQQQEIEALKDELIHCLPLASKLFASPPDPPDRHITFPPYNARLAAQALLDDACRTNAGTLGIWRERAIKLCDTAEERESIRRIWLAAIDQIHRSVDLNDRDAYHGLRIQLIAGYRRKGYK